jgi:hypothetical protein
MVLDNGPSCTVENDANLSVLDVSYPTIEHVTSPSQAAFRRRLDPPRTTRARTRDPPATTAATRAAASPARPTATATPAPTAPVRSA